MLVYTGIYNEAIMRLLQKNPQYFVERIVEQKEQKERYVAFEAVVKVNIERNIDVIEKFILKLLDLPLKQRKTVELINDTLNIGTVFVKSYLNKLQSYGAITEQHFEYKITATGKELLEKEMLDIESKESQYQFLYNVDKQQIRPWQTIKQLTKIESKNEFVTEDQFLALVQEFDEVEVKGLKVKSLQQQAYISDVLFEVDIFDSRTSKREILKVNYQGEVLSKQVNTEPPAVKLSQIEQRYSLTSGQAIPVTKELVSYKILQAKKEINLAFKQLQLEVFSVLDLFFVRKARVPVTVFYENLKKVEDQGTVRDIRQYYTIKTTGRRPLCFIHSQVAFDFIVIDETSLFYLEGEQWYYHADWNNWFDSKVVTQQLLIEQLQEEKDETLWYPLLQRLFIFHPTSKQLLAIVQEAKSSKPINFVHRFEKLLVSYQIKDATLIDEVTRWKKFYYQNKKAST